VVLDFIVKLGFNARGLTKRVEELGEASRGSVMSYEDEIDDITEEDVHYLFFLKWLGGIEFQVVHALLIELRLELHVIIEKSMKRMN